MAIFLKHSSLTLCSLPLLVGNPLWSVAAHVTNHCSRRQEQPFCNAFTDHQTHFSVEGQCVRLVVLGPKRAIGMVFASETHSSVERQSVRLVVYGVCKRNAFFC